MSVRKVYRVVVDGSSVFSGSYAMAMAVYESFVRYKDFSGISSPDFVVMAFTPSIKSKDDGGLLNV